MLKSSFEVFDLDNSGKISREEFKSTLRCLGYTASDEEIDSMMVSYDSNGDGLMDFDEFLSLVKGLKSKGYSYGKEAFEKELKNAFRYDVNFIWFLFLYFFFNFPFFPVTPAIPFKFDDIVIQVNEDMNNYKKCQQLDKFGRQT